jgi:multidrug resistance efflux pump
MRIARSLLVCLAVLTAGSACSRRPSRSTGEGSTAKGRTAAVTRGDLAERLLLTGELDAVSAESLVVPRTPQWNLAVRWLESDGTFVTSGQKVAEFDNSAFVSNLAEKKLAATQSASDLAFQVAQNEIVATDKKFEVEKARIAVEKARVYAGVGPESYPKRTYQEKQLELQRAQVALAKATDELESQLKSAALDLQVKQIALEKAQREIKAAEDAVESVVLRAPRDGIVVIADHPWEGRKLDVGDNVWIGLPVVRLPDLRAMKVNALLSDVDDGRVTAGMRAVAYLDAYPDLKFPGSVTEVSPVAREPSQKSWRRSFLVTVALERTDPERMLPGMSVRVEVEGKRADGALIVPRASIELDVKPPRVQLDDGSTVEVEPVLCNTGSCAIRASNDKLREGTLLGSFPRGGT